MTDPRENLAAVLANHFTAPHGQLLDAADAIIAALPDLPDQWLARQSDNTLARWGCGMNAKKPATE